MMSSRLLKSTVLITVAIAFLQHQVDGFSVASKSSASSDHITTTDRRAFLGSSMTTVASVLLLTQPVLADDSVNDLSMPTEDEIKKDEVSPSSAFEVISFQNVPVSSTLLQGGEA